MSDRPVPTEPPPHMRILPVSTPEMMKTHAGRRGQVRLADGRTVTLVHWSTKSGRAKCLSNAAGGPYFGISQDEVVGMIPVGPTEVTVVVALSGVRLDDDASRDDLYRTVRRALEDAGYVVENLAVHGLRLD